jgi:hypothetical protein
MMEPPTSRWQGALEAHSTPVHRHGVTAPIVARSHTKLQPRKVWKCRFWEFSPHKSLIVQPRFDKWTSTEPLFFCSMLTDAWGSTKQSNFKRKMVNVSKQPAQTTNLHEK